MGFLSSWRGRTVNVKCRALPAKTPPTQDVETTIDRTCARISVFTIAYDLTTYTALAPRLNLRPMLSVLRGLCRAFHNAQLCDWRREFRRGPRHNILIPCLRYWPR